MELQNPDASPEETIPNTTEPNEVSSNDIAFESRIDLSPLQEAIEAIKKEVAKLIVGQNEMVELLIISILTNGHSLIEGVPGVAKTISAKLLAKTMDIDFSRIQFTPDLMPSDILGTSIFNVKSNEFE
ncbi:AAA family ATPase, partial [Paucihalobacter sp.]